MKRRRLAVVPLAALLAVVVAPGAADAVAPTKAGWWNAVAAGGVGLPLPTTATGDLHVGQGPVDPTAYAAVGYDLLGQVVTSAVLELTLTNVVGTPALAACLTKDTSWKAAEDGDMAEAPAYDCTKGAITGIASAAGDSVTFLLDERSQLSGSYSLALVPAAGSAPFQVDIVKPGAQSLTISGTAAVPPPPAVPAAAGPPPAGGSGPAPLGSGTVTAPTTPLTAPPAPALAGPATPAQQPVVAPPAPVAARVALPPVSNRERYIAGSLLALLAGALVWALQQPLPTPQLIGGLARVNGPPPADGPVRGIGRFASVRIAPARRLV